jgi:hypothetical protein
MKEYQSGVIPAKAGMTRCLGLVVVESMDVIDGVL